ncbi:MAG: creatininase family protein [Myxococcales bacterium]|nr:creatininase family protein [Myxococcales bacterium]MCB9567834.1 creatininase family protein [Myxococcales bacterium]MCB9700279.1 creatininase family protein [Myxococcales bacterium]
MHEGKPVEQESARSRRLGELTYPEVEAIVGGPRPSAAIIPVGSTEAHGPHLPLATDSIISEGMATRAGELLAARGIECVVMPTIHYAVTEWARAFKGSTSIGEASAFNLVLDTCRAAKSIGFDRVAIVSAHLEPGHIAVLRRVARAYEEAEGEPLVFPDKTRRKNASRLTAEFQSGSCHAGQYETSLVLALRPELVRQELAGALPRHEVALVEHIQAGASGFLECGMEQAYCGSPADASAAEGEATLAVLGAMIADAIAASLTG